MEKLLIYIALVVLTAGIGTKIASASALTEAQVSAIVSLLQS
jgi:hypothetical protein